MDTKAVPSPFQADLPAFSLICETALCRDKRALSSSLNGSRFILCGFWSIVSTHFVHSFRLVEWYVQHLHLIFSESITSINLILWSSVIVSLGSLNHTSFSVLIWLVRISVSKYQNLHCTKYYNSWTQCPTSMKFIHIWKLHATSKALEMTLKQNNHQTYLFLTPSSSNPLF